jgi:predicted negative regulator of RcsB-dependent stress response
VEGTFVNDLTEKEQLEEMRAWWVENGRFVITGLVLGIAIIFGWNQWRTSITTSRVEASILFEQVMDAVQSGDYDLADGAANDLFANYSQTVYPAQSRLAMARLYMERGRDQDAADMLRELIGPDGGSEIQLLGRLRLARILLYQNKPGEVVALLKDIDAGGFAARYSEVLGDAYGAQENFAEAQTAYVAALGENAARRTVDSNLVQLKLNDLPDLAELATLSAAIEAAIDAGENADVAEEAVADPAETTAGDDAEPDKETTAGGDAQTGPETQAKDGAEPNKETMQ